MFVMLLCFDAVFGSAVVTDDLEAVAEHFNVYLEEVILAVTLFVIGFGTAKKFMNSFVWSVSYKIGVGLLSLHQPLNNGKTKCLHF